MPSSRPERRPRLSRPYRSPVRQRQAEGTRAAILEAARHLFVRSGYQPTTINAIAARAEVSVPTVYLSFGSKASILTALVASAGADADIRALAAAARSESDPRQKLVKAAHVMRTILEREGELSDLLAQAGSGDPELVAAWRLMHANRHRTLTEVLEPVLNGRREAARRRAVDVAWALSSPEMFRLLTSERNWTPAAYERWLADSLVQQLLGHRRE